VAGAIQNVWFAGSEVSFAPDVGRIAYLRPLGEPAENRSELVIALSNGSNESLNFEENRITIAAWSPDSSQLLYWYEGADGRPMVYLANAADGSTQLADGLSQFQANVAYFQWLDATAYVQALYRGADNFIELGLINLDGTGVVIDAYQSSAAVFDVAAP
jgi:X-X-X-Leu-X-X-Gly heptad repeat protein